MSLSRLELWARLGRAGVATTLFDEAANRVIEHEWRGRMQAVPHGEPWYSSLHVSAFPGDEERWCARRLLYGLMGHPESEPVSRDVAGTAKMGQAVEDWNVENTEFDGRLLSAPSSARRQTGLEDADHWLTGSPDFVVLPKYWNRPHGIETKSKDREVIIQMRQMQRSYDAGHGRQARGYLGVGHHVAHLAWPTVVVCRHTWRIAEPGNEPVIDAMVCVDHGVNADSGCLIEIELQPMTTFSLIYFARERPGSRQLQVEYLFEHDEAWFQSGLAKLARVRDHFLADELPPHPFGGKEWSKLPCQWCAVKRNACKPDHQAGVTTLTRSLGNSFAAEVYGHFDADKIHQSVVDRWAGKSGQRVKMHDDDTHLHQESAA